MPFPFRPWFKDVDEWLAHIGVKKRSGRYPWGSGENPYQHPYRFKDARAFYDYQKALKKAGLSDSEIASYLSKEIDEPMNTTQFRAYRSIAKDQRMVENRAQAMELYDKGMSKSDIARAMGVNESNVRNWLNPVLEERTNKTKKVADALRKAVAERGVIDVSAGTAELLGQVIPGVTENRLNNAIAMLEAEGYHFYNNIKVPQLNTGHETTFKVIAPPDVSWADVQKNTDKIGLVEAYWDRDTDSIVDFKKPRDIDSSRVQVRYAEQGGADRDGTIEVRRGVPELDLGDNTFTQVRISVDGTHYLKGVAIYGDDDMPKGTDIIFNTNKPMGTSKLDCFKKLKDDPDMPFGSVVTQREYTKPDGTRELSALNIVNEEDAWDKWSRSLSSQFLSKQKPALAKQQLKLVLDGQQDEYERIMALTNPVIRQKQLESFAEDCESKACHMKGAALPGQTTKCLIPLPSLRPDECYCPEYPDGTVLACIRFPHANVCEIPVLRVNNKNEEGRRKMGQSKGGIGIHPDAAKQASGADFDGDNFVCIPDRDGTIKVGKPIRDLIDFEPKEVFKKPDSAVPTGHGDGFKKGMRMGLASNLITDMTLGGASLPEIIRAIKYSMVVIDAEKHNLDWQAAYKIYGIKKLEHDYTAHVGANGDILYGGGSTLISMRKKTVSVPEEKMYGKIDKETGELIKAQTGRTFDRYKKLGRRINLDLSDEELASKVVVDGVEYPKYRINKRGYVSKFVKANVPAMTKKPLVLVEDAHNIGRGTKMEGIYADHIEALKTLANKARLESVRINATGVSNPRAKEQYAAEYDSLMAKLDAAQRRRPYERQAQRLANAQYQEKLNAHPEYEDDEDMQEKLKKQCLMEAKARVGLPQGKKKFPITEREWEAIQAGVLSAEKLKLIYDFGDPDDFRALAMPKNGPNVTKATIAKIKARASMGYSFEEIAKQLGISTSTVKEYL